MRRSRRRSVPRIVLPLSTYFPGLSGAVLEYRFAPPRRWRFDIAWPDIRIALEQDGGIWTRGRHSRGAGQLADMEKLNEAARLGWRVGRFTPAQVRDGTAARWVALAMLTR